MTFAHLFGYRTGVIAGRQEDRGVASSVVSMQTRLRRLVDVFESWGAAGREDRLFHVLAIDYALTTTTASNDLQGVQHCLARTVSNVRRGPNWYRSALRTYFHTAGSLLAHPDVVEYTEDHHWSLVVAGDVCGTPQQDADPLAKLITWNQPFNAVPKTRVARTVPEQLGLFAEVVRNQFVKSAGEAASCGVAILWVYVGPRSTRSIRGRRGMRPDWGASLFVTFRAPSSTAEWWAPSSSSAEFHALESLVELLYADLAVSGYVRKHRVDEDERATRGRLAQTIAHEVKHWSGPPLRAAIDLQIAIRNGFPQDEITARAGEVVAAMRLLNSMAIGMHRLLESLTADDFVESDDAVWVVRAAARVAIHLIARERMAWHVNDSLSFNDALAVLADHYADGETDGLIGRPDLSILLFVVSEACRNVRARSNDEPLSIWTEANEHERAVEIHQNGRDDGTEAVHTSDTLTWINEILRRCGSFCEFESHVNAVDTAHFDGTTHRVTTIKVNRIPKRDGGT